jgi:hypothetical protein
VVAIQYVQALPCWTILRLLVLRRSCPSLFRCRFRCQLLLLLPWRFRKLLLRRLSSSVRESNLHRSMDTISGRRVKCQYTWPEVRQRHAGTPVLRSRRDRQTPICWCRFRIFTSHDRNGVVGYWSSILREGNAARFRHGSEIAHCSIDRLE